MSSEYVDLHELPNRPKLILAWEFAISHHLTSLNIVKVIVEILNRTLVTETRIDRSPIIIKRTNT